MFYAMRGICEHAYSRSIRAVHVQFSRYAIDRVWAYWKEHSPLPARPTCAIGAFAANYDYCHNALDVVQREVFRGTKLFRGFNPFPLSTWILYHAHHVLSISEYHINIMHTKCTICTNCKWKCFLVYPSGTDNKPITIVCLYVYCHTSIGNNAINLST